MKKLFFLLALCGGVMAANAQKTEVKKYVTTQQTFSQTQARMVEIYSRSYAMPLVAEVEVASEQMKILKVRYSNAEVDGMDNDAENLRKRMLYDATNAVITEFDGKTVQGWNCDLVVAPSFKITSLPDGNGYEVEMKGFPGNFKKGSWRSVRPTDYEWIKIDKTYGDNTTQGQAVSNVKK